MVGMPLWFATPPDDPLRAENALDDFVTRTALGLQEIGRGVLKRPGLPFARIIVRWDTTPQALREWGDRRSAEYGNPANVSPENPLSAPAWRTISDVVESEISKAGVPESDAPSMGLWLDEEVRKKASGAGPYPELVEALGEVSRERDLDPVGPGGDIEVEDR